MLRKHTHTHTQNPPLHACSSFPTPLPSFPCASARKTAHEYGFAFVSVCLYTAGVFVYFACSLARDYLYVFGVQSHGRAEDAREIAARSTRRNDNAQKKLIKETYSPTNEQRFVRPFRTKGRLVDTSIPFCNVVEFTFKL